MQEEMRIMTEGQGVSAFKEAIEEKFFRWFPLGTWGPHKFELSFRATRYEIRIVRSTYAGKTTDKIRINIGEELEAQFEEVRRAMHALQGRRKKGQELAIDDPLPRWETQEAVRRSLRKLLQKDYIDGQLFVPAGRAFFTSIGKAYALFENSDSIDPLTLEFGRLFAARMDRDAYPPLPSGNRALGTYMQRAIAELLKGEMIRKKNKDYLRTPDGRQVPVAAMSSGQQELLPLLRVLPRIPYPQQYKRVFYIEEPEAHLFPDAQSNLVGFLTTLLNLYRGSVDLVLTTHSPYVLAKFNNLIKAGSIGRVDRLKDTIAQIIKPDSWLRSGQLVAYAICDRKVVSVIDEDGLINGDYLDRVSGDIANEFEQLLTAGTKS